jgi:long-chain fatty acid transport protein
MDMKRGLSLILTLAAFGTYQSASATNGYFTHGLGVKNKGMAGAGTGSPDEVISAASNPAAAVMVGNKYEGGISVFSPRRSYKAGPSQANGNFGAFTLGPNEVDSGRNYFPIPYLGKSWQLDDNTAWALNFYGRGGMNTDYSGGTATLDPDGPGPAPVTTLDGPYGGGPGGVNLSQAFLDVTYAMKTGGLNLGVSGVFAFQGFSAKGTRTLGGFTKSFAASGGTVMPTKLGDNGTDYSYGFGVKVGAIYEVNDQLNLGFAYQSKTYMSEFDDYADLFAGGGDFDIPASVNVSASYAATQALSLHFTYERTMYSKIASVGNGIQNLFACPTAGQGGTDLESCLGGSNGPGFGWDDVDAYKFGVEWAGGAQTTYRAGFSTAKQPISNDQVLFNVLAPGVVEKHFTVGLGQILGNGHEISAMFMYAPSVTVSGANTFDPSQQLDIEMSQYEFEIGYSF